MRPRHRTDLVVDQHHRGIVGRGGLDAYEQAGGTVMRDLFVHDDGGWLQDVPLLDRLATEKLKAEAETIAAEGWKWIAVQGRR